MYDLQNNLISHMSIAENTRNRQIADSEIGHALNRHIVPLLSYTSTEILVSVQRVTLEDCDFLLLPFTTEVQCSRCSEN